MLPAWVNQRRPGTRPDNMDGFGDPRFRLPATNARDDKLWASKQSVTDEGAVESERADRHAHLLITMRRIGGDQFSAKKVRDLDPEVRRAGGRAMVTDGEGWGATTRTATSSSMGWTSGSIRPRRTHRDTPAGRDKAGKASAGTRGTLCGVGAADKGATCAEISSGRGKTGGIHQAARR
jgi:hypothetical protein